LKVVIKVHVGGDDDDDCNSVLVETYVAELSCLLEVFVVCSRFEIYVKTWSIGLFIHLHGSTGVKSLGKWLSSYDSYSVLGHKSN